MPAIEITNKWRLYLRGPGVSRRGRKVRADLSTLTWALVYATVCAVPAVAQARSQLTGRVIDAATGDAVAAAEVSIALPAPSGWGLRLLTGDDGLFERELPAGRYDIEIRRSGYVTLRERVELRGNENTAVEFRLQVDALPMPALEATADAGSGAVRLGGFRERRERGAGFFFTREDIERRRPHQLADLFRDVPGARIVSTGALGGGQALAFGRQGCPADVYVDGVPHSLSVRGLNELAPEDVEAIEVYTAASTPAMFNRTRPGPACGVIVIWTRTGQ